MTATARLVLPLIAASQSQPYKTHNDALELLDALVQGAVIDRDLTAPPGSPASGDTYIPAATATGAWVGQEDNLAVWIGGAWVFLTPAEGWRVWAADEDTILVFDGAAWVPMVAYIIGKILQLGVGTSSPQERLHVLGNAIVAEAASGARSGFYILEEELTALSGATVDTTIQIPNGANVLNVSERVTTAITGATSFDVGTAAEPSKFGGTLSISAGSTNLGTIGSTGFYADTPIRLTANGGNFTGGAVRIAIHYYLPRAPQS